MRVLGMRTTRRRTVMVVQAAVLLLVWMLVPGLTPPAAAAAGESLLLSVAAERVRGGVATPCPPPCHVGTGDTLRYAVTLENVSGGTLHDIRLGAPVPGGTTHDAAASTIPSEPFSLITGAKTYIRQVTVPPDLAPGTIISFSATASYEGGQTAAGSPASHTAGVINTSDVSVSLSAAPDRVKRDGIVRYTISLANAGPHANTLRLTDALADKTTFSSISAAGGTCSAPNVGAPGTVTCDFEPFASGATTQVILEVQVGDVRKTSITNRVSVEPLLGFDPDASDNDATVTFRVK